ncbi:MAG: 4-hydroxythreonine-4-phosphate dehydrogenase PdxA [Sphingomonadaceae bacterium]|uniref:4-hydroxythreonine-4-phosphate dehydrogenase PdxA n=1 Tax=Thermaurantiacus sp. TaxID=2820283 RepID=UPI00298EF574|nr:4-hydroxythreonine-4-phosphate dehydrogenase PdxA [Thermaurantiacus sp.]MCS6986695.1 4-hydroxythreonine-4-phosphate dehydrogenase PdxA [Sphingomonadaceae bacterium]MDW8414042.1 4-hydroxythreonine-4-phosphate dehydrogenase PdxA [Thermaurantiacus sp.]
MRSSTIVEDPGAAGGPGIGPGPLAVTMGDPAGIGPEVVAKAWAVRTAHGLDPFFAIGSRRALAAVFSGPVETIAHPEAAAEVFPRALPLLPVEDPEPFAPGVPGADCARTALDSLELGVGLVRAGAAAGLVTGPVAKGELRAIGFVHPGQTEFVAERCGVAAGAVAMMMVGPDLKTVPVTIHLPLSEVPRTLTVELVLARARTTVKGLQRDFGLPAPRLAVAGLNPHAGEGGMMGREEAEVIVPAIEALRAEGIEVTGPHSADALFHAAARAGYDAALCMYHDQALIPVKTLYFDEGVNMTLGLPILRTSPDHGTAFGIAGRGVASPRSMIAAIRLAGQCARARAAG